MKRISLEELLKFCKSKQNESYMDQYQYIMDKISRDEIRPVKASKLNGKKPSLHLSYWLVENVKDYSELEEELKFGLPTAISTEYYLRNLSVYEQEREWVRMLADYLEENPLIVSEALMENENKIESDEMRTNGYSEEAGDGNDNRISLNERSF